MWFGQAMLLLFINATLLFGVSGYALRFGGWAERYCALVLLIGSIVTAIIVAMFHQKWALVGTSLFMADTIALLALIGLALASDRFWPLYAAAFQVPVVATHIAKMVDAHVLPAAYALAQGFWIYPILIALFIATSGVRSRQRRSAGSD